jgi:hypothetical protein
MQICHITDSALRGPLAHVSRAHLQDGFGREDYQHFLANYRMWTRIYIPGYGFYGSTHCGQLAIPIDVFIDGSVISAASFILLSPQLSLF